MKERFKAVIIGGGFSGLITADLLSSIYGGENVAIIERNDRLGKKITATGNGRGNISNINLSGDNYHSVKGADVSKLISRYGNSSLIEYFRSLGLDIAVEDGKIYPSGFQASAVSDVIRNKIEYDKVEVFLAQKCNSINKIGDYFEIKTENCIITAEKVILACGGKAQKQYGTDGASYTLAEILGHSITELYPSLVQLKTETNKIKGLKGLKESVKATVLCKGKPLKSYKGDLLFTDYGISGNVVFYLSSYVTDKNDCEISVEFLPEKDKKDVYDFLIEKSKLEYITCDDLLTGVINKQIGRAIIKSIGVHDTSPESISSIVDAIKNFNLKITGTLGFDYAQVTRGGIPFKEIDGMTMESLKCKGLYVVGEMLDVDGDCGGYNLQWAYTSSKAMSESIRQENENR